MKTKSVIVIPIYQHKLAESEIKSFNQCINILKNHKIVIVSPFDLDTNKLNDSLKYKDSIIDVIKFESKYFLGTTRYSQLLISPFFYAKFSNYDYILIYQLDAWVFSDQLEFWAQKKFDFIGAPWFEGYGNPVSNKLIGVGNGGFSLRNVKSCIKISKRVFYIRYLYLLLYKLFGKIFERDTLQRIILYIFRIEKKTENDRNALFEIDVKYEDYYWTVVISRFFDFKIATLNDAISFGFEVNPEILYSLNNEKLPFGAHAWQKYSPQFWKKFIF
ncbi:MAG: DUF5672 family protein [Bacteroidota bacterium]|nr:DUF5672 family protein [Bacteroidota bacterium]